MVKIWEKMTSRSRVSWCLSNLDFVWPLEAPWKTPGEHHSGWEISWKLWVVLTEFMAVLSPKALIGHRGSSSQIRQIEKVETNQANHPCGASCWPWQSLDLKSNAFWRSRDSNSDDSWNNYMQITHVSDPLKTARAGIVELRWVSSFWGLLAVWRIRAQERWNDECRGNSCVSTSTSSTISTKKHGKSISKKQLFFKVVPPTWPRFFISRFTIVYARYIYSWS